MRQPIHPAGFQTLRVGLEARYRLRPDARFLLAVAEIHRILVGGTS